jgi:hypothetical protein
LNLDGIFHVRSLHPDSLLRKNINGHTDVRIVDDILHVARAAVT